MAERSSRLALCILAGGLTAGTLDHLSACATLIPHGASAIGMLQYIASGAIGQRAFSGGLATAALGLAVHLSLTTTMAAVYVFTALRAPALLVRPWISGIVYGILIFLVMNYIAVPLSFAPGWKPPTGWGLVGAVLASCLYVGAPIAAFATHFFGPRELMREAGLPGGAREHVRA